MPNKVSTEKVTNLDLIPILDEFSDVFLKSQGLPPSRVQDHAIHFNLGAEPINVKPYRYPYFQKQVMEQWLWTCLGMGLSGLVRAHSLLQYY